MFEKLFPWFQPIIEVSSGRVVGYEALARMENEKGQVVSAAGLFNSPELEPHQRLELDRHVRAEALKRFAAQAQPDQYLSINLSPEWIDSLETFDVPPTLHMLKEAGVRPEQVVIEITEVHGDVERICALAQRYRDAGVRIAFDDFGSGFQQLDRVLAFTPDIIKIDMRMFSLSSMTHQKSALLQMMGDLGARIGCKVVFEGVETEDELFLALHCNACHIQGFLFARALPEFVPPDALKSRVDEMLANHLNLAVEESARRQWHIEGLHTELLALRELLLAGGESEAPRLDGYRPDPDILRFFICNRQGLQISSNWSYGEQGWQQDDAVEGANWSWRPYFYQLVGAADYERRVLRSSPYLDIATGLRCFTLTLALDAHRILLVDVAERAQGSRPMSALIACHSDLMPALS